MPVLWPELPGVLVRPFDVVRADFSQDFLQIKLGKEVGGGGEEEKK